MSYIFLSEQQIEQLAPEADHAAHSAESAGKFIQFSLLCQATIQVTKHFFAFPSPRWDLFFRTPKLWPSILLLMIRHL